MSGSSVGRGVTRNTKKGVVEEDWAAGEIKRLDPLIDLGTKYLESELKRVTKEKDNSLEAIRILKYLEARRIEAARQAHIAADRAKQPKGRSLAEERARLSLGG